MADDGVMPRNDLATDGSANDLWERTHDHDLTVSVRQISSRRFQIASFYPDGQRWAEVDVETAAEAKRLCDAFVRDTLAHGCSAACGRWVLSDLDVADWIGADEGPSASDRC